MAWLWDLIFGPPPNLRYGARNSQVERVQDQLNRRNGAGLKVDGAFGPLTDAAVKKFQREYGLVADGIVGPKTRAALNRWW